MRKRKIWLTSIVGVLLLTIAAVVYVNDYYKALPEAFAALEEQTEGILIVEEKDDYIAFVPEDAQKGVIFYPGGKVEYEAYVPLLRALAERGVLGVLLHMPMNLAVFDMAAAEGIREKYPEIEEWYMGGHSLGGSMAASYVDQNAEEFEGLILLAAYSTAQLTDDDLQVVSIYGSEDKVLNMDKYKDYRSNLPEDTMEVVIEGGCHAYFGAYGPQKGDGVPGITASEQIQITVDSIISVVFE